MKTLTEFSGVVLRQAASVRQAAVEGGTEADALADKMAEDLGIAAERAARLIEAIEAAGNRLDNVRLVRVFQGEEAPPRATSVGEFHYVIDFLASARKPASGDRRGGRGKPGERGRGKPGERGRGKPGGGGDRPRGDRPPRGDFGDRPGKGEKLPTTGAGWALTRAPRDERDGDGKDRKGPRRGKPGRKPRGEGGERKPRRDRKPRAGAPAGAQAAPATGVPTTEQAAVATAPATRPSEGGGRGGARGNRREPPMPVVEERKGIAQPKRKRRRGGRRRKRPEDGQVGAADTAAPTASPTDGSETAVAATPAPHRRIVRMDTGDVAASAGVPVASSDAPTQPVINPAVDLPGGGPPPPAPEPGPGDDNA